MISFNFIILCRRHRARGTSLIYFLQNFNTLTMAILAIQFATHTDTIEIFIEKIFSSIYNYNSEQLRNILVKSFYPSQ